MAGSVNKVILVGHLGRDPEIRRTNAGAPIANLHVATSESWRDKATGERKERTEWHSVVVFNENLAKVCEQYLRKGSKVYIEGQLQTREYQDKDGQKRWTTEVVLQAYRGEITLLDRQESNRPPPADSADSYGTTRTKDDPRTQQGSGGRPSDLDDNIPF